MSSYFLYSNVVLGLDEARWVTRKQWCQVLARYCEHESDNVQQSVRQESNIMDEYFARRFVSQCRSIVVATGSNLEAGAIMMRRQMQLISFTTEQFFDSGLLQYEPPTFLVSITSQRILTIMANVKRSGLCSVTPLYACLIIRSSKATHKPP